MSDTETTAGKTLIPLRCPRCGGELVKPSAGRFKCPYCGTSFLPGEVFAGKTVDLREFYERAFAAMEEDAYDRAYEYFKRILETDSREYQAWAGKGIAGAYARLSETGQVKAGEVLSCVDMALARYDGDDKAEFQCQLADRVGALAVDLLDRVRRTRTHGENSLRALFDLLAYWEERGAEELGCWTATVAVAESPVVTKNKGIDGRTYYASYYPFENVAQEYAEKIRAKYDPTFINAFERRAAERARFNKDFMTVAKIILIAAAIATAVIIVSVVILCIFGGLISSFST